MSFGDYSMFLSELDDTYSLVVIDQESKVSNTFKTIVVEQSDLANPNILVEQSLIKL